MKAIAIFSLMVCATVSSAADASPLESFCPHFSADMPIVWQAPTNSLPNSFWTYKRIVPRVFSEKIISNAMVLASLQDRDIPKASTNDTCIMLHSISPCANICNFLVQPPDACISFDSTNRDSPLINVPHDQDIAQLAAGCARKLGLDPARLKPERFYTHLCATNQIDHETNNRVCGRGIFLARQLDGIVFYSAEDEGGEAEGFSIEFGDKEEIRAYSLRWPEIERGESQPTATIAEIENCIRAREAILLPDTNEETYFQRVKALASARKFTVTKMTPYYGEGVFGETPYNNIPGNLINPFIELEGIAVLGASNVPVRFECPIILSDVKRLLERKIK